MGVTIASLLAETLEPSPRRKSRWHSAGVVAEEMASK